jgi:hypothetical protein
MARVQRPTAPRGRAAKLEFSSKDRSKNKVAGQIILVCDFISEIRCVGANLLRTISAVPGINCSCISTRICVRFSSGRNSGSRRIASPLLDVHKHEGTKTSSERRSQTTDIAQTIPSDASFYSIHFSQFLQGLPRIASNDTMSISLLVLNANPTG